MQMLHILAKDGYSVIFYCK